MTNDTLFLYLSPADGDEQGPGTKAQERAAQPEGQEQDAIQEGRQAPQGHGKDGR